MIKNHDQSFKSEVIYASRKKYARNRKEVEQEILTIHQNLNEEKIKQMGYNLGERFTALDYEITKLDVKFINPIKRESRCTRMVIAELSKK